MYGRNFICRRLGRSLLRSEEVPVEFGKLREKKAPELRGLLLINDQRSLFPHLSERRDRSAAIAPTTTLTYVKAFRFVAATR